MRVLLSGVVPGEGRYSMLRTARTLLEALPGVMEPGSEVRLHAAGGKASSQLQTRTWQVKLRKRLLLPLSLRVASFDVLHIVDSDYAAAIPPNRLARAVVTCHDLMPLLIAPRLEDVLSAPGVRFFKRSMARMERAARVVCDSAFTRGAVLRHTACEPGRVSVIPLGVEPAFRPLEDHAAEAFRERHEIGPGPLLLHVGSADAYKNAETVLRVTARVRAELNAPVRLLKVGGRFSQAQLDVLEGEGLAGAVLHLTGLSEEDLIAAYNAADLLLWPSHFEGFGWPVLEAMACGLPVVCSDGGSLPEVAGDAAAVCAPTDIDGLTAACARILSDPGHAEAMRARGLAWAGSFTWERTARAYDAVYREIAKEAGR